MRGTGRITAWARRVVSRTRERSDLVDHVFRAVDRYQTAHGSRLAAAIAYYGFFATFALGVVAFAVLGFLVEYQVDIRASVEEYLQRNLPVLEPQQIVAGRGLAGGLGLVALVFTGIAWVEALRSSQRQVWGLEQKPGSAIKRRLVDVVLLAGLALLLGLSLAVTGLVGHLIDQVPGLRAAGWLLQLGVNLVLSVALLAALPRLRFPARRLLPAAIGIAVGLVVLNTLGRFYITRIQENPAYAVVATAAGLLVYLYLVHQLVLFAAAWAATGRGGEVVDRAAGPARTEPDDEATGE